MLNFLRHVRVIAEMFTTYGVTFLCGSILNALVGVRIHPLVPAVMCVSFHPIWWITRRAWYIATSFDGRDWLEAVELLGFALPRKTRERVFTPYYEDMKADYLETIRLRTPWKRRLLAFCFTIRTATMIVECIRVVVTDRVLGFLFAIIWGKMQ